MINTRKKQPSTYGCVTCESCEFSHAPDVPEDVKQHRRMHRDIDAAAAAGIFVHMGDLEKRKSDWGSALFVATTDDERLQAMEGVCRCHWERSMALAIRCGTWKNHPSFNVYASAYDVFDGRSYHGLWRTRHPYRAVPGMKPGMSYWDAPKKGAPKQRARPGGSAD